MTMLRVGGLSDVLTPLSDCRQECPSKRWIGEFGGFRIYIIKIKINSSCEIEDFVETHHLCKLCVILRSRALRLVCPH